MDDLTKLAAAKLDAVINADAQRGLRIALSLLDNVALEQEKRRRVALACLGGVAHVD